MSLGFSDWATRRMEFAIHVKGETERSSGRAKLDVGLVKIGFDEPLVKSVCSDWGSSVPYTNKTRNHKIVIFLIFCLRKFISVTHCVEKNIC